MGEKEMRLQKLMAWRGVASRRASEELIKSGKVSVNGERAKLGMKVDMGVDTVRMGKKVISQPSDYKGEERRGEGGTREGKEAVGKMIYIMMNKPTGVVTTASDELGRKTVLDLLKTPQISDTTKQNSTTTFSAQNQEKLRISPSLISTQLDLASREGDSLDASSGTAVVASKSTKENPHSSTVSFLEVPKMGLVVPKSPKNGTSGPKKSQKVPNLGRVWAVGRLDQGTSGLLILTNDGELTQKLTHPSFETEKTYVAICGGGEWTAREREVFTSGIRLGQKAEKLTAPAQLKLLERRKDNTRKMEITITEGQNQQVRRMCKAVNHPVVALERMAIGKLKLDTRLKRGAWRELTEKEVELIRG